MAVGVGVGAGVSGGASVGAVYRYCETKEGIIQSMVAERQREAVKRTALAIASEKSGLGIAERAVLGAMDVSEGPCRFVAILR